MRSRFQFYKQLDEMDCGPTCIKMVARHYGKNISIHQLRQRSFLNRDGATLLGISLAAESIGFHTLGVKISFEKLKEVTLPCIVHWNQNHFVVVYRIAKGKVYVADPAIGLLCYDNASFLKFWIHKKESIGAVLILEPTIQFEKINTSEDQEESLRKATLFDLLFYLKPHKKLILQLALGLFAGSFIQLVIPFLAQSIVDVGIQGNDINFIYLVLAGQLFLYFGSATVEITRRWVLLHLSTRVNIAIISDFLAKLFKLPISFFESKMIGDILRRIEDHSRIEQFLSISTLSFVFSIFNMVVFGSILMVYNTAIFLIFSVVSIIYVLYVMIFLKKREEFDYKKFQQLSANQGALIEFIHGMPEIKLNNGETYKRWEWEKIQAKLFRIHVASTQVLQFQDAGGVLINEVKNTVITVVTALAIIDGNMTLGMMVSTQFIIGQLNAPLNQLISFVRQWQDARISLDRIGEIKQAKNEEDPIRAEKHSHVLDADRNISITNLSHYYMSGLPPVLEDINLEIPAGKVTAIVGMSGGGKTTLLKLLLKFYEPTEGKIMVGNLNLSNISASGWRRRCGVVMQDGYIFSDTIARNIALSSETIDQRRLDHAAKASNAYEFIQSLMLGYHTQIGANGLGLSQGQKQRILIARAIYKEPEYLFFDEATSSLDATNERMIMDNLSRIFENKTVVVIAHRLSTVRNADQILVLDKGKIVEIGHHSLLIEKKGSYYELVKNQLELV